ncbi:MAG: S8 family serine peptidase [Verrucomicrobiota bacterium]|nr:S8 family serine peptidase [Verrucomicrobiota bacterium]
MALAVCLSLALPALLTAATQNPKNIGGNLAKAVARDMAAKAGQQVDAPGTGSNVDLGDRAIRDGQGRLLVSVYLKNPGARDNVAKIKDLTITAEDLKYKGGALNAYIPAERVTQLANTRGVSSVFLSLAPVYNVGATTSQGVHQHRVDQITNQDVTPVTGITGKGIMVGVLSNSFDTSSTALTHAADDVASGDLPGPGNPNNSTPVLVLEDFPLSTDEGRAMCQIVHDMAPMANQAFATANTGEIGFANNIRLLAAPTSEGGAGANVIVDDVIYFAEGMFEDTIVARAVDDVFADGVSYFSSAGNRPATQGYYSDFRLVPNDGTATNGTNINLANVPPEFYAGGFHNFNPDAGQQDIAQNVLIGGSSTGTLAAIFDFQWDDPYDVNPVSLGDTIVNGTGTVPPGGSDEFTFPGMAGERVQISVSANPTTPTFDAIIELIAPDGTSIVTQDTGTDEVLLIFLTQTGTYTVVVTQFGSPTGGVYDYSVDEATGEQLITTDFNLLFFDGNGNFIGASGENNIQTNRPIEISQVLPSQTTAGNIVQVVIARSNTPPPNPQPASRVRYVTFTSGEPQEYFTFNNTPITFGHNSATGANGVAAYAFYPPFIPEGFTSPGPSIIAFDKDNNRLAQPEVREKPDMAAMDGANTTFFVSDATQDKDLFPNFFGTSAAAPHAAAIAALVLEANGGPGSVTPEQMRGVLQRSAFPHDLDPYQATGRARSGPSRVSLRLRSDGNSLISTMNPNAFRVFFQGQGELTQLVLNPEATDATAGNTTEPFDATEGFTSRPGLVFDNRAPTLGFPFAVGDTKGVSSGEINGTLSNQAPPPALVDNHFYTLTINIASGALTGGEGFNFGVDRDEADAFGPNGTVGGNSADLLGANVLIPEGTVAPGGMTFSGTTSNGLFNGEFKNRIGSGYTTLDGYGFINAEAAVNEPLQ